MRKPLIALGAVFVPWLYPVLDARAQSCPAPTLNADGASIAKWHPGYSWSPNGYSASDMTSSFVNPNATAQADASPFSVSSNTLSIAVKPTPTDAASSVGQPYISGVLTTLGAFSQQYGYFQVTAQMSSAPGTGSAFWLLPTNGAWPPEIDVAEVLGNNPTMLATSAHTTTQSAQLQGLTTVSGMTSGFHTYGVDWEANTITWYFDGQKVYQIPTPADMHTPMYLLLDTVAGTSGSWEGAPNGQASAMQVSSVQAYTSLPPAQCLTSGSATITTLVPDRGPPLAPGQPSAAQPGAYSGQIAELQQEEIALNAQIHEIDAMIAELQASLAQ